jgi:hypothetical protein
VPVPGVVQDPTHSLKLVKSLQPLRVKVLKPDIYIVMEPKQVTVAAVHTGHIVKAESAARRPSIFPAAGGSG